MDPWQEDSGGGFRGSTEEVTSGPVNACEGVRVGSLNRRVGEAGGYVGLSAPPSTLPVWLMSLLPSREKEHIPLWAKSIASRRKMEFLKATRKPTACHVVCFMSRRAIPVTEQHPGQGTKAPDTRELAAAASAGEGRGETQPAGPTHVLSCGTQDGSTRT